MTCNEFIDVLCEKSKENIGDKIADVEILGLENDGKPPVIRKVYIDYGQYGESFFAGYGEDDDPIEAEWKQEQVKLVQIEGDYRVALSNQLEKIIHFSGRQEYEKPTSIQELQEIVEYLSVRSMENFGEPSHFIDFENGNYAMVAINDMKIESCVYNKKVRAGIIFNKNTAFGVKTKEKEVK